MVTGVKKPTKVAHIRVSGDRSGQRLDNFVLAHLPGMPRSAVYRVIRKGQVRVNGGRAKPHTRVSEGDMIRIPPAHISTGTTISIPAHALQTLKSSIIHEQAEFMVIDKPSGMAVHGGSGVKWGVVDALRKLYPDESIELVHRLDRETSGCLLVAKTLTALRELREQFRQRTTEKRYLCLTQGRFREDLQVVDEPIAKFERGGERFMEVSASGKPAVTEFRLLEHYGRQSFVEAIPLTGRTHQVRVHAAFLGIPLAGDPKYSSERSIAYWQGMGLERLFLHAHGLSFSYPETERHQFNCPLPQDLHQVLNAI
jgi:23S rRNA pseudouridine955/2504/2580 synthase